MQLDVTIERIDNGFIIENHDGRRVYYATMKQFVEAKIVEAVADADKHFKEHDMAGEKRRMQFSVSAV